MKTFLYFGLSLVSIIVAIVILVKSLDIKSLFILLFSLAAGILFWLGLKEYRKDKKNEPEKS
jgi:ABC-type transport system involved in Fe-S cluster assembly fused permease/ATPase subunit